MTYFDDPAHSEQKAQWERELAALREEKQRRVNSQLVNGRKPQRENTVKLPTFEELVQQAALRHQNRELRRPPEAPRGEPVHQAEPRHGNREFSKPEEAPGSELKNQSEPVRGTERVRMTFAQLLAEEDGLRPKTAADSARQKQRTMEAGNAL